MSRYWGLLSGVSQQARQVGSLSRDTRTDKGKLQDIIPVDNEIPPGLLGTVPGKEKHHCKSIECLREVEVVGLHSVHGQQVYVTHQCCMPTPWG